MLKAIVGAFGGWQSGSPVQNTIAGMYEQLLPTRLCASQKTHTSSAGDAWCGLYGKAPENVDHIMSGCGALAQSKYPSRHDSTLKVSFYDLLLDLGRIHCRCSSSLVLCGQAKACVRVGWRISLLGRARFCTSWRCDARIVNYKTKRITTLEKSCPWFNNREREKLREDCKVCPPPKLEIKTYSSSLVTKWNNTTKSLMPLRVYF